MNFQVSFNCNKFQTRDSCGENAIGQAHAACLSCPNPGRCKIVPCQFHCVCRDGYIFSENNNSCVKAISTTDLAMSSFESSSENFVNGTSSDNTECGKNMEYDEISTFCHLPFIRIIYNFLKTNGCKPICVCKKGYTKNDERSCKLIRTHPFAKNK
ncbi:unnamed protein product [Dracunculus medinensis]|uniref:TIL domain-containing protein n=1 Tax=Dracunculus medinensis TaxID=318479 RepID=A0A0N4UME4_DRAME|nr:unnamed protein product [Dracunculus medinensis]